MKPSKNILIFFCGIMTIGCSEWDFNRIEFTKVITVGAIEVGSNVAFLLGDIEVLKSSELIESGFVLSSTSSDDSGLHLDAPGILSVISNNRDTIREERAFAARIAGLQASTSYAFRAYAKIIGEEQVLYGNIGQFKTTDLLITIESIRRSSEACETTAKVEVSLDGFAEGGGTEVGLIWIEDVFIGAPTDIKGSQLTESFPGTVAGSFVFDLAVSCAKSYTLAAYASSPAADTVFTELVSFTLEEGGKWVAKSIFPGKMRDLAVSFSVRSTFSMGGGKVPFQGLAESTHHFDFWSYTAENDMWSEIGQLEEAISSPIASTANDMAYFGAGQWSSERCLDFWGGDCSSRTGDCAQGCHCMSFDFFKFDPSTSSWNKMLFADSITKLIGRHGATSLTINNKIYIGMGNITRACGNVINYIPGVNGSEPSRIGNFFTYKDMWQFDPSNNKWKEMQRFPREERINAISYSIGDKGYVGLGTYYREEDRTLRSGPLYDFYEFNPDQPKGSQWKALESFPEKYTFAKGFALGDIGYVMTKDRLSLFSSIELWKFDRKEGPEGTWTQIAKDIPPGDGLPTAAASIGSVALIYLAGPDQNFWMYVPELL